MNTVDTTDISYGRREGEAIIGRSQEYSFRALKETRKGASFEWKGLDSDTDLVFNNQVLCEYCQR